MAPSWRNLLLQENFTAPRMVLAASGVEHEELLSIAETLDLPKVSHPEEPKSVYLGGDYRCQGDSLSTHVALAFEVPGGWHNEKDTITLTLTVLQMLMGGGGSFSAGGPGKGMYSWLYLRVLNEFHQIQSFSAFTSIHNNTCIFGSHAMTGSKLVSKAVDLAARELHAVATPGQVDQVQLDCAKVSTKSAVLMNLESRMVASEDIGRQILTYGERKPLEHLLKAVDEVTTKDISSLAEKIISSLLTMAFWGDGMSKADSKDTKLRICQPEVSPTMKLSALMIQPLPLPLQLQLRINNFRINKSSDLLRMRLAILPITSIHCKDHWCISSIHCREFCGFCVVFGYASGKAIFNLWSLIV